VAFARGVAWEISKKLDKEWKFGDNDSWSQQKQSCKIEVRFNHFNTVFESCKENFAINLKGFCEIFPGLHNIERWKCLSAVQDSIPLKTTKPVKIVL
jgi:hypothetical protein